MQKEISSRHRQIIYTLYCTLDPQALGPNVKSVLPPNAFDSERIAKCRSIVDDHLDPHNDESAKVIWADCKTLMSDPNEPRVVIACFFISKLMETQKFHIALVGEFTESLLLGSTYLIRQTYIDFVADLFHTIVVKYSENIFQTIERYNSNLIRELFSPTEIIAAHRYLAYSFINQIIGAKQYLVWKELKNFEARKVFETVVEETPYCQAVATAFLTDMMRFISKLDKEEQKHYFSNFVMTLLMQSKESKSDKFFRLFNFTYRYIFGDLNKGFFSREQLGQVFEAAVENIRQSLARHDPEISRLVCEMVPAMVQYQPSIFVENRLLDRLLDILYGELLAEAGKPFQMSTRRLFTVLIQIFTVYGQETVSAQSERFVALIVNLFVDAWWSNPPGEVGEAEALGCLKVCLKNVKSLNEPNEDRLQSFVSYLLIYYFEEVTLQILESLNQKKGESFGWITEQKLRYTTALILKREVKEEENDIFNDDIISERQSRMDPKVDIETMSMDFHRIAGSPQSFKEPVYKIDGDSRSVSNFEHFNTDRGRTARFEEPRIGKFRLPNETMLEKQIGRRPNQYFQFQAMLSSRLQQIAKLEESRAVVIQERLTAVALDALARFEFKNKFTHRRKNLIKDAVFDYLESDSVELRRKAGRIVFLLISDEKNQKEDELLSDNSLQGIIKKIMAIAIGDPDDQVRVEILHSLNTQMDPSFVPYILSEDNLKTLVVMLSDVNHRIQEQTVLLIQKLIPSFPELLTRFDQIIFASASFLVSNRYQYSVKTLNNIRLLGVIARHSQFLLKSRLPVIISIMVTTLDDCFNASRSILSSSFYNQLLCVILETLGHLFNFQPELSREYFRRCMKMIMHNLPDRDQEELLSAMVCFMITMVRMSGFQMIVTIEFQMLSTVLELLETSSTLKLRTNLYRLLGSIGAIDSAIIRTVRDVEAKLRLRGLPDSHLYTRALDKIRKNPFNFERHLPTRPSIENEPLNDKYDRFVNDAFLVQKDCEAVIERIVQKNAALEAESAEGPKDNRPKKQPKIKSATETANVENYNEKIQNEDYLLRYVIYQTLAVLFDNIFNQTDTKLSLECLESLQQIILVLGRHVHELKKVIFYRLLSAFKHFNGVQNSPIRVLIVQNIKYFAKASSAELANDPKSVSKLSKLLLENLQDLELRSDLLIVCRLLVHNKSILQHRFKDIVLELLKMLRQTPDQETIDAIFEIIIIINHNDYYYLITPALLELFPRPTANGSRQKTPDFTIVIYTLKYLRGVFKTKHFENYFGNILRALISVIEAYPQIKTQVADFLLEVFQASGERCFNYLPLINPYLKNNEEYQRILRTLNEKGYIEVKTLPTPVNFQSADEIETDSDDRDHTLRGHSLRRGSFDSVKDFFLINNFNKSDFNWNDWYNRLKNELIQNSSSTVLIACKNLLLQRQLTDRLFKPAFVFFWSQLNDHQKSQITRGFDSIISNTSKIQMTVRKKILELVEFMSHPNEFGMELNITKLADFAINCHNPSKAIFFKEMEFQMNPVNATEALLNLYLEVGHRYSAEGLLDYVQNTLGLKVEEKWLLLIGKWDVTENPAVETKDATALQIHGSIATSNWESAFIKIKEVVQSVGKGSLDPQIATYYAKAALHLSRWDVIKKIANDTGTERDYYKAVAAFTDSDPNYQGALDHINEEIKALDRAVSSFGNYSSYYEKWVQLQKYVELEEATLCKMHFSELSQNKLYNFLVPRPQQEEERRQYERFLLEVWEDKLAAMEYNIDYWQEILAARNIFFTKNRMLDSYLKFSGLCYYTDNSQLFTKVLSALKKEIPANMVPDDALELAEIECNYKTSKIDQKQAILNIETLAARRTMPKEKVPLFYKKMGPWIISSELKNDAKDEKLIRFFERFLNDGKAKEDPRLWHFYAIANYQMIKDYDRHRPEHNQYVMDAVLGFTKSVVHETKFNSKHTIQDLLKLLKLWYDYHNSTDKKVIEAIEKCTRLIPNKNWLLIIRQLISRMVQSNTFSKSVRELLSSMTKEFPQYMVFPLLLAYKFNDENKIRMIKGLLGNSGAIDRQLVQEATLFSDQLIRISLLLDEMWLQSYPEASKFKDQNKIDAVIGILNELVEVTPDVSSNNSLDENAFCQKFDHETNQIRELLKAYEIDKSELYFIQIWNIYTSIIQELDSLAKSQSDILHLETVSPELFSMKNSLVAVPGTLKRNTTKQKNIRIIQVKTTLRVLKSKRRPRKLSLFGSDAKEYSFLLKGKEDLRLDERVMQLLTVVNDMLKPSISELNQALKITTYNVLPLSYDCGIISWLEGFETVYETIRDYRIKTKVNVDCEREIWREFNDNYNVLSKVKKLEVYNYVCANTRGQDLKNIFWLRSPTADIWLLNRNNFIVSVAVMSMVGYILGLGDRHLMNIMIDRTTAKIVHIDFGECFESEQKRERLPEKVPFRLTRMMVNAMEACGTEGTFKRICETTMNILRLNRDVIFSFFQEFVVDPLMTWTNYVKRSPAHVDLEDTNGPHSLNENDSRLHNKSFMTEKVSILEAAQIRQNVPNQFDENMNKSRNGDAILNAFGGGHELNLNAKVALDSIINKLAGRDFESVESDYKVQVRRLIKQATSPENISQAYTGWNPFL